MNLISGKIQNVYQYIACLTRKRQKKGHQLRYTTPCTCVETGIKDKNARKWHQVNNMKCQLFHRSNENKRRVLLKYIDYEEDRQLKTLTFYSYSHGVHVLTI